MKPTCPCEDVGDWDTSLCLGHQPVTGTSACGWDTLTLWPWASPLPVFFAWQKKQKNRPINNWDGSDAQKDSAGSL